MNTPVGARHVPLRFAWLGIIGLILSVIGIILWIIIFAVAAANGDLEITIN